MALCATKKIIINFRLDIEIGVGLWYDILIFMGEN